MICPKCGCHDRVMRTVTKGDEVYRLRRCIKCGHSCRTEEKRVESGAGETRPQTKRTKKKPATAKPKPEGTLEAALASS